MFETLEIHAVALGGLIGALGVIAALLSAWASWRSAGIAKKAQGAVVESERLLLISQASDARFRCLTENRRLRLRLRELRKLNRSLIATGKTPKHRLEYIADQIKKADRMAEEIGHFAPPGGYTELQNASRDNLVQFLAHAHALLHEETRNADHFEREADRLHNEFLPAEAESKTAKPRKV